jgi:hypothetical protein
LAHISSELAEVLAKINVILEYNSDMAIEWSAAELPAYITEDENGNISGCTYSRTDVSNVVFSLDQVRKLMTNQAVTQGDHLGNINKLSKPMPLR